MAEEKNTPPENLHSDTSNQGANTGPNAPLSQESLRSVHTSNFPDILRQLGISLVVSTYQAGKLIFVRPEENSLNTHFAGFNKPMGVAVAPGRMSVGTAVEVWELRDNPAVAPKIEPTNTFDSFYMPRQMHITGDIDIHEMAYDSDGELWLVNTRFGCLCNLDIHHSFVPRWYPPFIDRLLPEDRCHLNGLGMRDGRPRYVTALGKTNTLNGWRENKVDGGILMDIKNNEIILEGLSMPHSPRWYKNQLWVLESGKGTLSRVNAHTKEAETIVELPGFTRGLDFYGPLAFVGLSQVRETAVFSGIPITETAKERICGVWVVNIETKETIAFLRFEEAVQEIFAVQVLPSKQPHVFDWGEERIKNSYTLPEPFIGKTLEKVDGLS